MNSWHLAGADLDRLTPHCGCLQVGHAITKIPDDFNLHRGVKRVYDQRRQMIETGEGIDWGFAEALAFGTLISEGRSHLCHACS